MGRGGEGNIHREREKEVEGLNNENKVDSGEGKGHGKRGDGGVEGVAEKAREMVGLGKK